ncbi:hypothetical protein PABG_11914 [Paracoccidioides brasiliensis Pb03]|nr:hypothetical protein PABG_11914 [Paracoccidioides brasiliensis Pb03]
MQMIGYEASRFRDQHPELGSSRAHNGYGFEFSANMLDRGCKVALFLELERCLHVRAQDASQMSHRLSTLSASYRFTYRAIVRVGRCTSSTVDSDNRRGFM